MTLFMQERVISLCHSQGSNFHDYKEENQVRSPPAELEASLQSLILFICEDMSAMSSPICTLYTKMQTVALPA